MGRKERKGSLHKEKRDLNKQKEINYGFTKRVLTSVKSVIDKKK